jgi:hypothetical protein
MSLLFLGGPFDNDDRLIINATSTFCAHSSSAIGSDTTLWEINPVAKTRLSTTTITGMIAVLGITPDGSIVFGMNGAGDAIMWSGGTTTVLPDPGSGTYPQLCQMNGTATDGTPVGEADGHWDPTDPSADAAIVWQAPYTSYSLFTGSGYSTRAFFASAGGDVVTGLHTALPTDLFETIFKWTVAGSVYALLPSPGGSPNVAVRGISSDGTTIIGVASTTGPGNTNQAIYWDNADALHVIGLPSGATWSDTFGVSSDGSIIGVLADTGIYRWTVSGGFVATGINDPVISPGTPATLSADGSTIMTPLWWIPADNVAINTTMLGDRMIAADARTGIGFNEAFGTSGVSNAFVFFPPSAPPPPPGPTVLNMGHVIATSLATESPCTSVVFSPAPLVTPSMGLHWSDTRGAKWGNPVPQPLTSDPLAQPIWNRTGYARDRVFELFWSFAFNTALNGAFVDIEPFES